MYHCPNGQKTVETSSAKQKNTHQELTVLIYIVKGVTNFVTDEDGSMEFEFYSLGYNRKVVMNSPWSVLDIIVLSQPGS